MRSDEIGELIEALAKAQAEIKAPHRNKKVKVETRAGGEYGFSYATLDQIIETIRGPLTKNDLWFSQRLELDNGVWLLVTTLFHTGGQWLATPAPLIFDGNSNQQFGSALTFMRRYSLTTLLGIAAEEDDDANTADGNTIKEAKEVKPDVITSGPEPDQIYLEPGEMKVQKLIKGGNDWLGFGKVFMAGVRSSRAVSDIDQWNFTNTKNLDLMSQENPKAYSNLLQAVLAHRQEMEKNIHARV